MAIHNWKPFNKYEAVILLDYYLQYLNGTLSRKEAIQAISEELRELAQKQNIIIDDTYRNIKGIDFQIRRIESAYKGYTVSVPATKLFLETVELFKTNRRQFDMLLQEVRDMTIVTKKDNQENFAAWLSNKVSPTQISTLYLCYEMIDEFCMKTKVLKESILQTTDINLIKSVQRTIEQNKVFRFQNKKQLNKIYLAMKYYIAYAKENLVVEIQKQDEMIITKQKSFDKYEAAILLDYYLQYLNGTLFKNEAIQAISEELRELAQKQNNTIDDMYRNIVEITSQMSSMESAYKGYTVSVPATKLFLETVELFKKNRKQFDILLQKARGMTVVTEKDNRENFVEWLSNEISSVQFSELYKFYETIDEFCIKAGVFKESILQITDINLLKLAQRTIEQNKVFCFQNKKQLNKIYLALRYYMAYIEKNLIAEIQRLDNIIIVIESVEKNENPELPIVYNEQDKIYANIYPVIYKKIYESLKNLETTLENNDITIVKIYENIEKVASCEIIKEILENVSWSHREGTKYHFLEPEIKKTSDIANDVLIPLPEMDDTENIKPTLFSKMDNTENIISTLQINFKDIADLSYTKPLFVSYFGEELQNISSWKQVYICIFKKLYEDYSDRMPINEPISGVDFYTSEHLASMRAPSEIEKDKYLETNLSATNIVRKIKVLLDICLVDAENLVIKYEKKSDNLSIKKVNTKMISEEKNVVPQQLSVNVEPFTSILIEKFPKGYRIGSPRELGKFKEYWKNIYGNIIDIDDDTISKSIEHCGIIYEDKVYMPQKMLDDDTKTKLFSYINNSFQSGKNAIYYEALFKEFSDDFFGQCMYNTSMLQSYLSYMNDGSYCINKNFISKDRNVSVDPYDEIKSCLIQQATPIKYNELFTILSHIPEQKIKNILTQNDEFISNSRGEYFHINAVTLSDDELEDIANIIQYSIDEKQFISGNELVDSIKRKYPDIIEQNTFLSDKGLRDAIKYKLKNTFSFKGNIISSLGQSLSMKKVFADFCKHKDSFTLDELKILKQELDTTIYFDDVYENSLRISKNKFVSKVYAKFKPEQIDATIDRFCIEDYIAIGKIKQFSLFPDAGFSWNSFLLEHYVASYSLNYKLIHSSYNEECCVGGIVKKFSNINTIDELIIDVLAKSRLPLQKETALQYLCEEGYLARRSYSNIEQLLIKAKEQRNQKGL